jgi:uncharacterized protein YlxW (UPF0749 family)
MIVAGFEIFDDWEKTNMVKKDTRFLLFFAFIILGVMVSLQFRSAIPATGHKSSLAFDYEQLKVSLAEEIKKGEELRKKEVENIKMLGQIEKEFLTRKRDDTISAELEVLRLISGLTDVKGSGLVIFLDDAPVRTSKNPNDEIIHDGDIVKVLNELKKAGAQAISVNGERIISTSEQVCAGTLVRINNVRYAVPYEIKVIGNSDQLELGLNNSQIIASLRKQGIRINIEKRREITIEKYKYGIDNLVNGLEAVRK